MIIAVTGHRPDKLFGYDMNDQRYTDLKNIFKKLLTAYSCNEAISGMALGVDTIFAKAVLELRDEGFPVTLHCAIPCLGQEIMWSKDSQKVYNQIIERADKVTFVSNEPYTPKAMSDRNHYMVDRCDLLMAVWNGSKGGTYECVTYANKKGVPVELIRITQGE